MTRLNRTTLPHARCVGQNIFKPLLLLCVLTLAQPNLARADDLTGLPVDDPKDLQPAAPLRTTTTQSTDSMLFVPLPLWARGVIMPPLPEQLKPMGKKPALASAKPQPLAPPKDAPDASSTTPTSAGTKSPADSNPAMITVSPFLQWIKANPQAAAATARQQANSYHAGPPDGAPGGPAGGNPNASGAPDDSYWLPPLIDSADFGTKPVGGSAAIYSTPQR